MANGTCPLWLIVGLEESWSEAVLVIETLSGSQQKEALLLSTPTPA
jgi:hypothetical protein